MNEDFATAMRRALEKTCASDPKAATAVIQAVLAGHLPPEEACGPCARLAGIGVQGPDAANRSGFSHSRGMSGLPGMEALRALRPHGGASPLSGLTGTPGKAPPAPVPDGARVEMRRHNSAHGARDYRLFVPSPREAEIAGLVIMLHGCTQSPEDFALGTGMDLAAEKAGFVVAYPGQTGQHNAQSCWNWFRPEDQARDRGEPAILAALAESLAGEFDIGGRVYVAGLSAGGAMTAVLAETHPHMFAAVGIHSGLPAGTARDLPSALLAMQGQSTTGRALQIPSIVFHGTIDTVVSPRNATALVPGSGVETRHEGDGRSWSRLTTQDGSELWLIDGAGHAWSGGNAGGSYTDPAGPDASGEMLRFFLQANGVPRSQSGRS
jgi:poly(hydroxyalkanoate) depolymerase family esterase